MVAALVVALALFVWRANPSNTSNCWFAAFTLAVGAWTVGVGGLYVGAYLEFLARFTFAAASLILRVLVPSNQQMALPPRCTGCRRG